jgi:hypothetical protein
MKIQLTVVVCSIMLSACASVPAFNDEDGVPVTITGVHHLGNQFTVDDFAVDGRWAGNVGRQGGGGSYVCCVLLPRKWREGLKVEVRWKVSDWTYARQAEIDKSVYTSVKLVGNFRAMVPIERYDSPEALYVHFIEGGRARAVSALYDAVSVRHPIPWGAIKIDGATQGVTIGNIYKDVSPSR